MYSYLLFIIIRTVSKSELYLERIEIDINPYPANVEKRVSL
jgi:hypothetical protein